MLGCNVDCNVFHVGVLVVVDQEFRVQLGFLGFDQVVFNGVETLVVVKHSIAHFEDGVSVCQTGTD